MKQVREGLVFKLPVASGAFALGQVLRAKGKSIFVVVFGGTFAPESEVPTSVDGLTPFLLAHTFTARFTSGDWTACHGAPLYRNGNVLPNYKIERNDGTYLTSFEGKLLRKLAPEEVGSYAYELHVAPIRLEKALALSPGSQGWTDAYDKMLFDRYFPG